MCYRFITYFQLLNLRVLGNVLNTCNQLQKHKLWNSFSGPLKNQCLSILLLTYTFEFCLCQAYIWFEFFFLLLRIKSFTNQYFTMQMAQFCQIIYLCGLLLMFCVDKHSACSFILVCVCVCVCGCLIEMKREKEVVQIVRVEDRFIRYCLRLFQCSWKL